MLQKETGKKSVLRFFAVKAVLWLIDFLLNGVL